MSQESGMGDYESEVDENELDLDGKPEVSNEKLENLVKRQKVYGDITQNASPEELETLLRYHENKVPEVSIFHNMYSLSTVPTYKILSIKNARAWVSMVSYLKKIDEN